MKDGRKNLIKDLHSVVGTVWQTSIETEFPKLFKEEEKLNGWYKDVKEKGWCMFIENGIAKYGFNTLGKWKEDLSWNYELGENDYKATDKEVGLALIKEAKKRGFKYGVVADLTNCGYYANRAKILNENYRYNGRWLSVDNFIIFEYGKWATIVPETITKEQAEKELGKTIVD